MCQCAGEMDTVEMSNKFVLCSRVPANSDIMEVHRNLKMQNIVLACALSKHKFRNHIQNLIGSELVQLVGVVDNVMRIYLMAAIKSVTAPYA